MTNDRKENIDSTKKSNRRAQKIVLILFLCYSFLIIYFTILSRKPRGFYNYSLDLFWSYKLALKGSRFYFFEVLENIVMFIPEGIFGVILLTEEKKSMWVMVIWSLIFSAGIELAQYHWQLGFAELDDVFSNTLGTLIGVFLVWLYNYQKERHK